MRVDWRETWTEEFEAGETYKPNKADWLDGKWSGLSQADNEDDRGAARPACR
jgi:2-oxoglutarate dehydrogenase E1 component